MKMKKILVTWAPAMEMPLKSTRKKRKLPNLPAEQAQPLAPSASLQARVQVRPPEAMANRPENPAARRKRQRRRRQRSQLKRPRKRAAAPAPGRRRSPRKRVLPKNLRKKIRKRRSAKRSKPSFVFASAILQKPQTTSAVFCFWLARFQFQANIWFKFQLPHCG